jgi:hypothetical protein
VEKYYINWHEVAFQNKEISFEFDFCKKFDSLCWTIYDL